MPMSSKSSVVEGGGTNFGKPSKFRLLMTLLTMTALCLLPPIYATTSKTVVPWEEVANKNVPVLWREPGDIHLKNLFYGAGGKEHAPKGNFKFVEEDLGGTNPKFKIEDEQGVRWKVKLGREARPEVSATRLLWAVGYFTDEDYYLPELQVQGMKRLKRGQNFVSAEGKIQGARLERHRVGEKKIADWSWFKNPFVGTKELNGLKVLMALINNTDLKKENNSIYDEEGIENRYVVTDLGASFGKTGSIFSQSIGNANDYANSKFIKKVKTQEIDFVMHNRPPFIFIFYLPYYVDRTRMQKIVKHIVREDGKWIGQMLSQLSAQQIADAFRAGGFTPQEIASYTIAIQRRIAELNQL
jgi:hypothetical protein